MKKVFNAFVIISAVIFSTLFFSCGINDYKLQEAFYRDNNVETRSRYIQKLSSPASISASDEYDVFIISDVHFGCENRKGRGDRREDAWINLIKTGKNSNNVDYKDSVKFVICLGDIADHGFRSEMDRYNVAVSDELKNLSKPIPIYNVVGNHDLYNSGWDNWVETMYPHTSFYKFETPSFSWYFLDSASGTLGAYQFNSLEKDMKSDSKPKMIFTHVPVYAENHQYFVMQNTKERNKLLSLCARTNTKLFVDGHSHKTIRSDFGSFIEQNVPSFLQSYEFAVLHVNEATGEFDIKVISY